jgi:hypothetical protein
MLIPNHPEEERKVYKPSVESLELTGELYGERYKGGPTIAAICKSALTGKLGSIREYGGIRQLELVAMIAARWNSKPAQHRTIDYCCVRKRQSARQQMGAMQRPLEWH